MTQARGMESAAMSGLNTHTQDNAYGMECGLPPASPSKKPKGPEVMKPESIKWRGI